MIQNQFLSSRPAHHLPPFRHETAAELVKQLYEVLDEMPYGDMPNLDYATMAHMGELLEELHGHRQMDAAWLSGVHHGLLGRMKDRRLLGPLLCLYAAADASPMAIAMKRNIHEAAEDVLTDFAETVDRGEPGGHGALIDEVEEYLSHAPLPPLGAHVAPQQQLQQAQECMIHQAAQATHPIYAGKLAMQSYRLMRLAELHYPNQMQNVLRPIFDMLAQENHRDGLEMLGYVNTLPGETNQLPAILQMFSSTKVSHLLLPAPDLYKPEHHRPAETMANQDIVQEMVQLAVRADGNPISALRSGELFEVLQNQRGENGRALLYHAVPHLRSAAARYQNLDFLLAMGQALTLPRKPLETLTELESLPEILQQDISLDMLHGRVPAANAMTRETCEEMIQALVEDGQESERTLLGMLLQRYQFIRQLEDPHADLAPQYAEWMQCAAEESNLMAMHALGYRQTLPGQPLMNITQMQAVQKAQDDVLDALVTPETQREGWRNVLEQRADRALTPEERTAFQQGKLRSDNVDWRDRYRKGGYGGQSLN
jgi:hypothetical protein